MLAATTDYGKRLQVNPPEERHPALVLSRVSLVESVRDHDCGNHTLPEISGQGGHPCQIEHMQVSTPTEQNAAEAPHAQATVGMTACTLHKPKTAHALRRLDLMTEGSLQGPMFKRLPVTQVQAHHPIKTSIDDSSQKRHVSDRCRKRGRMFSASWD